MDYVQKRKEMVNVQLRGRDIVDALVLKAMSEVPRDEFLPPEFRDIAYNDCPLPIGEDQTISQPYIVALITQELELKGGETVLEIGAGSGYQAAILSRIVEFVYAVERIPSLANHALNVLKKLCYLNVCVDVGDGTLGLEKHAPYDAILVSASYAQIPPVFNAQLKEGGRIIMPVGDHLSQELIKAIKKDGKLVEKKICDCAFVPLIGEDGWDE